MPRPAYFELSAAEIRRRRARFYFEDAFYWRPATIAKTHHDGSRTEFSPGICKTVPSDRSHSAWQALGADKICPLPGCRFQVCRCAIGVVLDANMDPVEPYRAARLEDC